MIYLHVKADGQVCPIASIEEFVGAVARGAPYQLFLGPSVGSDDPLIRNSYSRFTVNEADPFLSFVFPFGATIRSRRVFLHAEDTPVVYTRIVDAEGQPTTAPPSTATSLPRSPGLHRGNGLQLEYAGAKRHPFYPHRIVHHCGSFYHVAALGFFGRLSGAADAYVRRYVVDHGDGNLTFAGHRIEFWDRTTADRGGAAHPWTESSAVSTQSENSNRLETPGSPEGAVFHRDAWQQLRQDRPARADQVPSLFPDSVWTEPGIREQQGDEGFVRPHVHENFAAELSERAKAMVKAGYLVRKRNPMMTPLEAANADRIYSPQPDDLEDLDPTSEAWHPKVPERSSVQHTLRQMRTRRLIPDPL